MSDAFDPDAYLATTPGSDALALPPPPSAPGTKPSPLEPFDPDKYLATPPTASSAEFDPDAYLKGAPQPGGAPAGVLSTFGSEAARTFFSMPGELLKSAGIAAGSVGNDPIQQGTIYKLGDAMKKYGDTWGATEASKQANPIAAGAGGIVGGFGAAAPSIVAAVAGAPLTSLGLGIGAGIVFAGSAAANTFDEALLKGADEVTAAKAAGLNGLVAGALGVIPLRTVLAPVMFSAPGLTGWAATTLEKAVRSGVVFTTVGEAQEFLGRQIANQFYDPNAGYSPDINRVLSGLIGGGIIGAVTPTMLHKSKNAPVTDDTLRRAGLGITQDLPVDVPPPDGGPPGPPGAPVPRFNREGFPVPTPSDAPGPVYGPPRKPVFDPGLMDLAELLPKGEEIEGQTGFNQAQMLDIVSKKMYGDPATLPETTVKEFLQNSFDAIKVLPDTMKKDIHIDVDAPNRRISIYDTGHGMAPDVLSGPFLEAASSKKETTKSSGRFGLAKLLTLYENEEINVVTMRDGVVSRLNTTGEQMKASVADPKLRPKIQYKKLEQLPPAEQKNIRELFPEGRGTRISVKMPEFYENNDGELTKLQIGDWHGAYKVLQHSPLFDPSINVHFGGRKVENIGSSFPAHEYTTEFNVDFPRWGTARVYMSKAPDTKSAWSDNLHILSNGIWQFSGTLPLDPAKPYGDRVPHQIYVDLDVTAPAKSRHYPFDLQRQQFAMVAQKEFAKLFNYLSKREQYKNLMASSTSYGSLQAYDSKGRPSAPMDMAPEKPKAAALLARIQEGAGVVIKDGVMTVNGKEIPELTTADLEKMNFDVKALTIPQSRIPSRHPILHNNVEIRVPGAGPDEYVSIVAVARQMWPERFDQYISELGHKFIEVRDTIVDIMVEEGHTKYKEVERLAVGLSIDETVRGVSIEVPFKGAFLNPTRPIYPDPHRIGPSFYDTMIHELAHYFNRNHEAGFRDDMKRYAIILEPYRDQLFVPIREIGLRYADIIGGLGELLNNGDPRTVGNRLKDAGTYEGGNAGRPDDISGVSAGGRNVDRLFNRSSERTEPSYNVAHPQRLAEEITGIVPEPDPSKGFRAYHGSPHDFTKVDASKRGTGEGGAAFSPGIYAGENIATGKRYQDTTAMYFVKGEPYQAVIPLHRASLIVQEQGSVGAAIEWLEMSASRGTLGKAYEKVAAIDANAAKFLRDGGAPVPLERRGNLYTMEVKAPKDSFMDWHDPIVTQPEKVQIAAARALQKAGIDASTMGSATGEQIHAALTRALNGDAEAASNALRDAGLPGIKYLDAGSRHIETGERTRNFVIYDPDLIDVTHKNDKPIDQDTQQAIHNVQRGAAVEDVHGRTIVNGYTVDGMSVDEMKGFAPIGTAPKGVSQKDGYAVNADAMKAAGVTDFPKTPVTEATGGGRNMLRGLFGKNPPPGAEASAVAADHFVQKLRWLWDFRALVDANPDIEPLQRHAIIEDHMSNEATQRQVMAEDTLKAANKLPPDEKKAVYKLIDDFMNARYMSEKEKKATGMLRKPTQGEFEKLVKDAGVGEQGLKIFSRMQRDFEKFVRDMMGNMRAEAQGLEPQKMAKELARIDGLEKDLLERPYFPATRFGLFSVLVQDPVTGTQFHRTETKAQQKKLASELQKAYPNAKIQVAKLPQSSLPFQGLPVQLLEFIEKSLVPKSKEAEELRNAITQLKYESSPIKGITSRVVNRILTPGYSHDFFRNYSDFFYHGSRYLSRMKYQRELKDSLSDLWDSVPQARDGTKRSEIAQFVQDRYEKNLSPVADWAITRGFMFHMALGFRVSSAATNLTQTLISTFPHLAAEFGELSASRSIAKATADWRNFYSREKVTGMTEMEMRALHELMALGRIRGALAPELAGTAEGRNFLGGYGGNKIQTLWTQTLKASAWMFEITEQFNRRVAGMATFDLALRNPDAKFVQKAITNDPQLFAEMKAKGFDNAQAGAIVAAKVMIDRTQFQYSREFRPAYLTGPIGGTVGMFKLFTHRMLWNLYNYPQAGMRAVLIMGFLGGLQGLPGFQDLNGILKAIAYNLFGKDFDLEDEARKFAVDVLGMKQGTNVWNDPMTLVKGFASRGYGIPALADFIGEWSGIGKIPIPELDRTAAISLNNILPVDFGTMFGPQAAKDPGDAFAQGVSKGMGAFGSYAYNVYKAMMNNRESLDSLRRWEKVEPVFLASMSHAARVWMEGKETSQTGSTILKFDPHDTEHMMEVIAMGLGYTPSRLSKEWSRIRAEREAVAFWEMRKEALMHQFYATILKKDPIDKERVIKAIRNFNDEVRGTDARGLAITAETLKKSVQSRMMAKGKQEAGVPAQKKEFPLVQGVRRLYPGSEVEITRTR